MQYSVALPRSEPAIRMLLENLRGKCNFLASRRGRYIPISDRLLRRREMTRWASFDQSALQQFDEPESASGSSFRSEFDFAYSASRSRLAEQSGVSAPSF
jgi:hypothetical protein